MPSTCHVGSNETPSRYLAGHACGRCTQGACVWALHAGRLRVGAARLLVDMVAHDVGEIVVEALVGLSDGLLPSCGVGGGAARRAGGTATGAEGQGQGQRGRGRGRGGGVAEGKGQRGRGAGAGADGQGQGQGPVACAAQHSKDSQNISVEPNVKCSHSCQRPSPDICLRNLRHRWVGRWGGRRGGAGQWAAVALGGHLDGKRDFVRP